MFEQQISWVNLLFNGKAIPVTKMDLCPIFNYFVKLIISCTLDCFWNMDEKVSFYEFPN